MIHNQRVRGAALACAALCALAATSWAAAPAASPTNQQLAAELARLQAEVREQRQLLMQLMRVEQQHYDLLMGLAQSARGGGGSPPAAALPGGAGLLIPPGDKGADPAGAPAHVAPRTAVIRGKVRFPGGSLQDLYVYLDGVKGAPAHGRTVEIVQRDKQFVPEVTVVQRGTKVSFPNHDSVFHNVFSPTPPHPFDLGSHRAGDPAKGVELSTPGVVEVFCNVHSRMHASVLVVPSSVYTRVGADGQFHLDGVPLGSRRLVVWSPYSKPAERTVEVGAAGGDVDLVLEAQPAAAHNNKLGQPYSSYKE